MDNLLAKKFVFFGRSCCKFKVRIKKKMEHPCFSIACGTITAEILGLFLSKQSNSGRLKFLSITFLSGITQSFMALSSLIFLVRLLVYSSSDDKPKQN